MEGLKQLRGTVGVGAQCWAYHAESLLPPFIKACWACICRARSLSCCHLLTVRQPSTAPASQAEQSLPWPR